MGVKYTTKKNLLPQMIQKAKELDGKKVEVGSFGDHAWLAEIHEFGCVIPVTDKMRRFLGAHGIHLKKETTQIVIPERSFLRAGFDSCQEDVISKTQKLLGSYLESDQHAEIILKLCGTELASQIKKYARDLKEPPKSEASKVLGSKNSNPLIQTGAMINNITYRIEDE